MLIIRKSLSKQYVPKVLQEKNICGNRLQIPSLYPIPPPKIAEGLFYSLHVGQLQRVFTLGRGQRKYITKEEKRGRRRQITSPIL
jgi:hypothetical protein